MLTRKRTNCILRLLGISSIFIISFLLVRNIVWDNDISTTLIAYDALQNTSSSCHSRSVFNRLTKSNERRCYPLLINFAHGCCKRAQKANCLTGLQYGLKQCMMFNKRILDNNPHFVDRNKNILQRKRGAGYWLWKPYIIFQELYLAREGDIIVYSDASVNFIANISYLIKLTEKQDILVFRLIGWKVRRADSLRFSFTFTFSFQFFLFRSPANEIRFIISQKILIFLRFFIGRDKFMFSSNQKNI